MARASTEFCARPTTLAPDAAIGAQNRQLHALVAGLVAKALSRTRRAGYAQAVGRHRLRGNLGCTARCRAISKMAQNGKQQMERFEVLVKEGSPHGDLYELEQTTYYEVVDRHSNKVVMTFQGQMQASLSKTGLEWEDYHFSGVCGVFIAPDEQSVIVRHYDGREEIVQLPG